METVAFLVSPSSAQPDSGAFAVEVRPLSGADQGDGLVFNDSETLRTFLAQFPESARLRVFWDSQVESRQAFTVQTSREEWDKLRAQSIAETA